MFRHREYLVASASLVCARERTRRLGEGGGGLINGSINGDGILLKLEPVHINVNSFKEM